MKLLNTHALAMAAALFAIALLPTDVQAGPPLVCFPFETGGAPSLPWTGDHGWKGVRSDYDRTHLVADTLGLLTPETPVIARMETLRRAAIYASTDRAVARELLARIDEREAGGRGKGAPGALALFDAGYLIETFKQTRYIPGGALPFVFAPPGAYRDGYREVLEAARLRGDDPAMEYAAALIMRDGRHEETAQGHLERALAQAPAGSPLARTIDAHTVVWGAALDTARKRIASHP